MVLAILAVSVSINAQVSQEYSANIPFDFEARGERHEAGKYRLGSVSLATPGAIALRDMKSGESKVIGISSGPQNNSWGRPGTLTFLKTNGKYVLTEVSTASFSMKMKGIKKRGLRENDVAFAGEVVKISLN
jgi:hypothetical protein